MTALTSCVFLLNYKPTLFSLSCKTFRTLLVSGLTQQGYYAYNLGNINNADVTIQDASHEAKNQNDYAGSVNATDWVKVTLDISGKALAKSGNLIAFKGGKTGVYDLLIDDITIE